MATRRAFAFSIAVWLGIIAVSLGVRAGLAGHALATRELVVWTLLACMPIAVSWMLRGGQPGDSISQVLYDVEHPAEAAIAKPADVNRG